MNTRASTRGHLTGIKEIHDASYISRILSKIAKQKSIEIMVKTEDKEQPAQMEALNLKGTSFKITGIDSLEEEFEIWISYNGYTYYFRSIMDKEGTIRVPDIIWMYNKRALERHKITDKVSGYIEIYDEKYRILDIHTKGISFNAGNDNLGKSIIRDARVVLDSATFYVDIEIAHVDNTAAGYVYGAKFISIDWADTMHIVKCVLNDNYSSMVNMGDASKNELYTIFNESGYFNLEHRGLSIHFDDMYDTLQTIDSEKHLSKSFMYKQDDKVKSCLNAIRVYDNTFFIQHLIASKEDRYNIKSKFDLYEAIIEYSMNNEQFKYQLAYIDRESGWHKKIYKTISDYINDTEKMVFEPIDFMISEAKCPREPGLDRYKVERLYNMGEFCNYAKENISEIEIGCYCYQHNNISVDNLKIMYEMKGLLFDRVIYKVMQDSTLIAYVVADMMSSGMNIANLTDNCRIYMVNEEGVPTNKLLDSIVSEVNRLYGRHQKDYYYVAIINSSLDRREFDVKGMRRSLDAARIMVSSEGKADFKSYFRTQIR